MNYTFTLTQRETEHIGQLLYQTRQLPGSVAIWNKMRTECVKQESEYKTRFQRICADVEKTLEDAGKKIAGMVKPSPPQSVEVGRIVEALENGSCLP